MSRILPILFNTDMVKAILDGRKTVTRQVMKPANPFRNKEGYRQGDGLWIDGYNENDEPNGHIKDYSVSSCWMRKKYYIEKYAPYQKGDILYVRETWSYDVGGIYIYKASYAENFTGNKDINAVGNKIKWHPSIHMPKEAARIWLKVTDVRVEQLQDMPHDGAMKEGIHICKCPAGYTWKPDTDMCNCYTTSMGAMEALWNSTIKKSDLNRYGWDSNPWVWVIEFKRCEKPEIKNFIK